MCVYAMASVKGLGSSDDPKQELLRRIQLSLKRGIQIIGDKSGQPGGLQSLLWRMRSASLAIATLHRFCEVQF